MAVSPYAHGRAAKGKGGEERQTATKGFERGVDQGFLYATVGGKEAVDRTGENIL